MTSPIETRTHRLARRLLRGGALAAILTTSALVMATAPTPASAAPIPCGSGMVCIYPQTGFNGQPYVRRAASGSVGQLPEPINEETFSVKNNSGRVARIYRGPGYRNSWTCVGPRSSIADLRGHVVNRWGSSVRINDDLCG